MTDWRDEQAEQASGVAVETRPGFEPSDQPPAEPAGAGDSTNGPRDAPQAAAQAEPGLDEGGADAPGSRWAEPSDQPPAEPEPAPEAGTKPPPAPGGAGGGGPAEDTGGAEAPSGTPAAAESPAAGGEYDQPAPEHDPGGQDRDDSQGPGLADRGDQVPAAPAEANGPPGAEAGTEGTDEKNRAGPQPGSPGDEARATTSGQREPEVVRSDEPEAEAPESSDNRALTREVDTLREQVAAMQADRTRNEADNARLEAENTLIKDRLDAFESELSTLREGLLTAQAGGGDAQAQREGVQASRQPETADKLEQASPEKDRRLPIPASAYGLLGSLAGAAGDLGAQVLPHAATGLENAGLFGGLAGACVVTVVEWRRSRKEAHEARR
jgi:hypothetical protein